jgi:hypothetical protein
MTKGHDRDRPFADKYNDQYKQIIADRFSVRLEDIDIASAALDNRHATDMIFWWDKVGREVRVGCRIQQHYYSVKYPDRITIRYTRDSGTKTEYEKIRVGECDIVLFCYEDEKRKHIFRYFIGNLNVLRPLMPKHDPSAYHAKSLVPNDSMYMMDNFDGTKFAVIKTQEIQGFGRWWP